LPQLREADFATRVLKYYYVRTLGKWMLGARRRAVPQLTGAEFATRVLKY